jgi:predicted metalloendopeptidase
MKKPVLDVGIMEKTRLNRILLGIGLGLALLASQALAELKVYRFTNAEGQVVVSNSIPNDRVKYGFEVLDRHTQQVLKVVRPQLNDEQAQAKAQRDRDLVMCKTKLRRVQALYRSQDDIDYSEKRVISSLENRIVNANANVNIVRSQLGDLQNRAAQVERGGSAPSPALVVNIERAETQIANLESEIAQRRREQDNQHTGFDDDRRMLKIRDCDVAVDGAYFQSNAAISKADH